MTGLTASSFLVSFFIFLSSIPVAGSISSTNGVIYSLSADECLIFAQKPRYCALIPDVIFSPPEWSIPFVNKKITLLFRKFPASRLNVNKSEQGESNAEGMGCTQQNFYSPVHSKPMVDSLY